MSDETKQSSQQTGNKPAERREMSRRQFLSYTLGGTGAFMMSIPLIWNLRFAVDPLLQKETGSDFVKIANEADITAEPQSIKFEKHVVDGWYESDQVQEAWVFRDEASGEIVALSPVCKHLGCTVNWNSSEQYPDQFFCPCHGAHYTKLGKNLAVAPKPLDEYEVRVDNGVVYLGGIRPNTRV